MANVKVNGAAMVITSGIKLEDWKAVAKFRPKELVLVDEECKDPVFKVGVGENANGAINKYGVTISNVADVNGYATVTAPFSGERTKDAVIDQIGGAIAKLNEIEAWIPDVLESIKKEREEIGASITIG